MMIQKNDTVRRTLFERTFCVGDTEFNSISPRALTCVHTCVFYTTRSNGTRVVVNVSRVSVVYSTVVRPAKPEGSTRKVRFSTTLFVLFRAQNNWAATCRESESAPNRRRWRTRRPRKRRVHKGFFGFVKHGRGRVGPGTRRRF